MNSLDLTTQGGALPAALRQICLSLKTNLDEDALAGAMRKVPTQLADWPTTVDGILGEVGLRGTWLEGPLDRICTHARPDLPLMTPVADGLSEGWMILDGFRFNRVHVWSTSAFMPQGWWSPDELVRELGVQDRTWARIEPVLPGAALSAPEGRSATPVARLMRLMAVERQAVGAIVVYAVFVGLLSLATPLAIQVLINWLAFGAAYQPVVVLSLVLLLFLTLAAGVRSTQRYAVELLQRRVFVRAVTDVGSRLARIRLAGLDGAYGPELVNRYFDVLTLQKATKTLLLDGLTAALQAAVGLLLLAFYHPYLLVFDVVVLGLALVALFPFLRRGQNTAIAESKHKYAVAAWMEEVARDPATFKHGGGPLAEHQLERLSRSYLDARAGHFRVFFWQYLSMQGVQIFIQVALLLTCGYLVLEGQLTLGQLVAAEFIVAAALAGLTKFTDKLETVYDLLAGVDKLGTLMDLPYERVSGARPTSSEGMHLELRQASYVWPGRGPTLNQASVEIAPGARVAILGAPGVGKSTVASILSGLREPTAGQVWRNGVPQDRILPQHILDNTLLLGQGGLFRASVLDNVTLGGPVDEQRIWEALDAVSLQGCISQLPEGLATEVGNDGTPLSASQARRLLIVRALLAHPRLLVIDGLLDDVPDVDCEPIVAALQTLPKGTTLVVLTARAGIANRFSKAWELREGGLHERPQLTVV